MKNTYADLIDQTFYFPTDHLALEDKRLHFHGIDLEALLDKYASPLRLY